jgi:hypothetical protein
MKPVAEMSDEQIRADSVAPYMKVVALLAVLAVVVVVAAVAATPARAGVVRCHARADFNLLVSSARNITCKAAARELRRYRGSIARRFRTPDGFSCYRVSGSRLAGQWRCVRGTQAFRFEFSD